MNKMKKCWKLVMVPALAVVMSLALAGVALAAGPGGSGGNEARGNAGMNVATQRATTSLTSAEQEILAYMLEEEKVARDVYENLYDVWGATEFKNIAVSEDRHMDRVERLAVRYDIALPATLETRGEFQDAELQQLYDDLIAQGAVSLEAAFQVGVTIEEVDIADLQELIDLTERSDIDRVAGNLLRASQNHLKAFQTALAD